MRVPILCALLVLVTLATPVAAQSPRNVGRLSFFLSGTTGSEDRPGMTELVTSVTARSPLATSGAAAAEARTSYGIELRVAGYPGTETRRTRLSLYEAWIGRRLTDSVHVRAGQLWLTDLGALGSVGGVVTEYRRPRPSATAAGGLRLRAGGFAGLEPRVLQTGYAPDIFKAGGYVALDGERGRRHVAGFVHVRNGGLTERSVITTTNYLPVGQRLFIYQAAEYDTAIGAGERGGALTYVFANGRVQATDRLDIQGTYHRGRSIDARTITEDHRNGRPVEARQLEGFLYESVGGRATVLLARGVRVFGGLTSDRDNRGDISATRTEAGAYISNMGRTGLDLNVTAWRRQRGSDVNDSWYISAGRSLTSAVYLSAQYSSAAATLRFNGPDFTINRETSTRRYAVSALIHMPRSSSLVFTLERTIGEAFQETRLLSGVVARF